MEAGDNGTGTTPSPGRASTVDRAALVLPRTVGRHHRTTKPTRRPLVLTVVMVVCGLLLASGWVGVRGIHAKSHLENAAQLMHRLQAQIAAADMAAAQSTLTSLRVETRAARLETVDPVWGVGTRLPGAGRNLDAVTTIADVLDGLTQNVLPPLIAVAGTVDIATLTLRDGRIDVAPLERAGPAIRAAEAALRVARSRIASINSDGLITPVGSAVADLRSALDHAVGAVATAARAATLLPPMLGLHGPRTFMVLFQNLAEQRATGGEMGAYAILRADQGRTQIVDQGTAGGDLRVFDAPVQPLDPAMAALYTTRLGTFPADVNATPNFPTAATLIRAMYQARTGRTVDVVVATDPVALSYLLRATGSVTVAPGSTLTADNAVRQLLSDVYIRIADPVAQDLYFAEAARSVFDTLIQGRGDPRAVFAGLVRAASERRLLVWSADPTEQAQLAGTVLGGSLPEDDGNRPTVGIFLNDGTGAKLGYYLSRSSTVTVGACRADGRRELRVAVTLASTAPQSGLPPYVRGTGELVPPYTLRTNLMIFSPAGGSVVSARRDGAVLAVGTGTERGRSVGVTTVELRPGQTTTVETTVLTSPLPAGTGFTPDVWTTPGVNSWPLVVDSAAPCAAMG